MIFDKEFINGKSNINNILFGEDQARYLISINENNIESFEKQAQEKNVDVVKIGTVIKDNISINDESMSVLDLKIINSQVIPKNLGEQ